MTSTWILVADAARARVFEATGRSEPWQEVACFANPDGRAPGRHATTERAPRVNESMGGARHAIEPHTSLRDKSTERFAHMLGEALERGRNDPVGAILAAPVRDTLKRAGDDGGIDGTEPRERLWRAFTPQLFRRLHLQRALEGAAGAGIEVTDEAMAMERQGLRPLLIEGAEDNFKITTPADLARFEFVLAQRGR